MKKLIVLSITVILIFVSFGITQAQNNSNFYLHENGVTIMCPEATVGETGSVNGIEYEAVDRALLIERRNQGADLTRVCTSLVTDMSEMFRSSSFNQQIGNWDVSNVTDMSWMFRSSPFNHSIENWNVGNVTIMKGMFLSTVFDQTIENWDVRNVTDMSFMFRYSQFNQNIGNWEVSSVTNMSGMFSKTRFNQPIGNWDVSNVIDMRSMFLDALFDQPIGNWDVSNVLYMEEMFFSDPFSHPPTNQFNQPINQWCVTNIPFEPLRFSHGRLTQENKPVWGTCGGTNVPFGEHPSQISLSQNYPNPFNPVTQIRYELPEPAEVRLEVFNVMGQRVATLVSGQMQAGVHIASFNAANFASGVYVYRLSTGNFVETRKMALVK